MTKSSRFSASLPRSTRTPLCELLAGRTRWPSRALAWYMPTMPWTWHAVNEAMLAMTSLATFTEPRGRSGIGLDPLHVGTGPGIDPDDVAFIHEEWDVERQSGLYRGRLAAARRRVAFEPGGRLRHLQVDRGGEFDTQRTPLVHQHVEGGVLFHVFHGVAQLVVAKRQLIVARQVHEVMPVTVAVKVLHGHLLDPGAGKAILVAELLIDDRPAPHVAELGAEEGIAAGVLALLELEHDPQPALPFDRHAIAKITGVDHTGMRLYPARGSPNPPAGGAPRSGRRSRCAAVGGAAPC